MAWYNTNQITRLIPRIGLQDITEIILLTVFFYYVAKTLRGTRAWILLKGIVIVFLFYALAFVMDLNVIVFLFQNLLLFLGLAVVVVMQPELRKLIEMLGANSINDSLKSLIRNIFKAKEKAEVEQRLNDFTIQEIVKGCSIMGKAKTGALIVIEQNIPLNEYVESGIKVNADITSQLLINIFEHNTPLHDGAIVVQNDKIAAATCYLPLSDSKKINKDLGTRHRAGIGVSEVTDSFVIIVSEETGAISVAYNGKLIHNIDREGLLEELKKIQNKETVKVKAKKPRTMLEHNLSIKLASLIGTLILWMLIVSTSNPITTTIISNVPIDIINTDTVVETGKTYDILTGETVNVTVRARKNIVDHITADDINVVADFSNLSFVNAIALNYNSSKYPEAELVLSNPTMKVSLEDIVTTEIDIEANQVGDNTEKYYVSSIDINPSTLIISGAKSIINTIDKVEVDVDTSNIKANEITKLEPTVYDKNGDIIDNSKLIINNKTVNVKVDMYNTKTIDLEINTVVDNKLLSSIIESIECDTKKIVVAGPDELLEQLEDLKISVILDIALTDVAKSQFIKSVSLQEYLPDGIVITQEYNKVNITVNFVEFYSKTIDFSEQDITVVGLGTGLEATIQPDSFKVNLAGISKTLEEKTVSDLKPYIDISNLGAGEHIVTVKFKELYSSSSDTNKLQAKVIINDKE